MNPPPLKIFGIFSVLILLANMILFALQKINGLVFWSIIILVAVFAYLILPKINVK